MVIAKTKAHFHVISSLCSSRRRLGVPVHLRVPNIVHAAAQPAGRLVHLLCRPMAAHPAPVPAEVIS
jgi:hypothetical protein